MPIRQTPIAIQFTHVFLGTADWNCGIFDFWFSETLYLKTTIR